MCIDHAAYLNGHQNNFSTVDNNALTHDVLHSYIFISLTRQHFGTKRERTINAAIRNSHACNTGPEAINVLKTQFALA